MRLTIKNINKAIDKSVKSKDNTGATSTQLSSYELSLFILLSKRCDLKGRIVNLLMKDAVDIIGFSKQTFYDCLYALEKKGFIYINHANNKTSGHEVLLLNNYFKSYKDTDKPYLNMYYEFLESKEYISLPVQLKRFIIRSLCFINQNKWTITSDVLKKYGVTLDCLIPYFVIKKSGINASGCEIYHLSAKEVLRQVDHEVPYRHFFHRIKALLENIKISYTLNDLKSLASTANTYKDIPTIFTSGLISSWGKESIQPLLVTSTITRIREKLKIDPKGAAIV